MAECILSEEERSLSSSERQESVEDAPRNERMTSVIVIIRPPTVTAAEAGGDEVAESFG